MTHLISRADLDDAYSADEIDQLADRDGDGVPDMPVLNSAIAYAHGLAMGALGKAGLLPLPNPLPDDAAAILKGMMVDLAYCRLFHTNPTEEALRRHQMAVQYFKDVAVGLFVPGLSTVISTPIGAGDVALTQTTSPVDLSGFM